MITLRDYLEVLRQRWLIVLVTIALATGGAVAFSLQQEPEYEASTRILIELPSDDRVALATTNVLTEAEVLRSEVVAGRVRTVLRLTQDTTEILELVSVRDVPQTDVLLITARTRNPQLAAELANTFAQEYIAFRGEQITERLDQLTEETAAALADARERVLVLERRHDELGPNDPEREVVRVERNQALRRVAALQEQHDALVDRSLVGSASQIIQFAAAPDEPANPSHVQAGVLGFLLSIPLAIGLALVRDALSDRVKTKEEAEELTGAQTLALVPNDAAWVRRRAHRVAVRADPGSVVAEAYRTLRVNVEFVAERDRTGSILVTSPGPSEGKTATSVNLAMAFAEAGRATVLISADLRRPRAHRFLKTASEPGLADVSADPERASEVVQAIAPNLRFVPSGTPASPDQVVRGRDAAEVLERLTGDADVAVVDAPAILGAAEASVLASVTDGVVLVVYAGTTRRSAAARAAEQIRRAGGRLLGLVLIGAPADDYRAERPARSVTT